MSLKKKITPLVAGAITSNTLRDFRRNSKELGRKITGSKHELKFYFRISDPYSYLLLQLLPELLKAFPKLVLKPTVMWYLPTEMYPEPRMLDEWSLKDAAIIAPKFRLKFPANLRMPIEEDALLATRMLLKLEDSEEFLDMALALSGAVWAGDSRTIEAYSDKLSVQDRNSALGLLQQRKNSFIKEGHYLSATLNYGGEWYWGVDRISHLVDRLEDLGLNSSGSSLDLFHRLYQAIEYKEPTSMHPLFFFFSFRSPYSYIALQRVFALEQKYQLSMHIKPVLPMVMRGLAVPPAKQLYILSDAKREADKYGVPFGKVCDPVGKGVENCLALYSYAHRENRTKEFLLSAAQGIWAEGKDVTSEKELAGIVERAGMNWMQARGYLKDESWRKWAEANRQELLNMKLWGVPSFYYNGNAFWGQDRIWALERAIQET